MANSILTLVRLQELLRYDSETGGFTWLIATGRRAKAGDNAGGKPNNGYLRIRIDTHLYKAHRLAWFYVHGFWPVNQIDHVDGNRANNCIYNLRDVTNSVNQQNRKAAQTNNKSGFLGVIADKYGWCAGIRFNGKQTHIGTYKTPELAHEKYLAVKRCIHEGCTI